MVCLPLFSYFRFLQAPWIDTSTGMLTPKWLNTVEVISSLLNIWFTMLWNQDSISCWVFVADDRDISKLKVEKIMWDSTPALSVYRWDFVLHSWSLHCCILCFSSSHNQRRKEKPAGKPDRRHCLITLYVVLFSLCHFCLFKIILIIPSPQCNRCNIREMADCLHLFDHGTCFNTSLPFLELLLLCNDLGVQERERWLITFVWPWKKPMF